MKLPTAVLILALASTNASKYFRPEQQYQREHKEMPYLAVALNEEQFIPLVEEAARWESPLDPRMVLFNGLDSLENFLQEDSKDIRLKRGRISLSIDNPLEVLRQQIFKAYERQAKNKSIERNREHFIKTGKRTGIEMSSPLNLSKQSDFRSENDLTESESGESRSNEETPTTRRYQNRLEKISYQT